MQCLLLQLKSWSAREVSCHQAFVSHCPTISHTCEPYLSSRWVLLFISGVAEWNKEAGCIQGFIFLFLVLIRWNELSRWNKDGRWVQDILLLPQGFESFLSDLPQVRLHNLVCVKCLVMIKAVVVGFCCIGVSCYSGWWV